MNLYLDFQKNLKEKELIKIGDSLILGVSGGPDSLVMLDLFARIKNNYKLDIIVFHLNHMFRKEAEKEAAYVRNIADKYGFPSFIEKVDVPKYIKDNSFSPEEGARKARFNNLRKIVKKLAIKKVAMAHNKDDQVETVFLNLIRGTGLKGLTGIGSKLEYRGFLLIHPLLFASRKDIEEYCLKYSLKPIRDPSNLETEYTRNKLRNHLIPYIEKEINPAVKDVIYRMSNYLADEDKYLNSLVDKLFQSKYIKKDKNQLVLSLDLLQKQAGVIRKRLLKKAVEELQGHIQDIYAIHHELFNDLIIEAETGKSINLKDGIKIRISYNQVIFEKKYKLNQVDDYNYRLSIPAELKTDDFLINSEIIKKTPAWKKLVSQASLCLCDYDKIELPLTVRNRKKGDRFFPFGMNGCSKKIKDFFIDQKIPLEKRNKIPIIIDGKKRIVWVAGYRIDDRFKISDDTRKILKIGINFIGGD